MGEGSTAFNSGRDNVTDRFINTFYYIDDLASLAQMGIKMQFRQALVGGFYTLLSRDDEHIPNSDYYAMVLWRRLVGKKILLTESSEETRVYSQCSREYDNGVVIEVVNIAKEEVTINSKTVDLFGERYEYRLTADSLDSKTVKLNGKTLSPKNGNLPDLSGVKKSGTLTVEPLSVV